MAGESPDRSKQRESSAEPTSGSAGPVPEARNSAEKRDLRLAVARESSPSEDRGSVDTATRVLSVREAAEDAAEAAEADGAPSEELGDSAVEGDGRLREAVAAWVRSADSDGGAQDTSGAAEAGSGAEDASADDESDDDAEDGPRGDGDTDSDGDGDGDGGARTGAEPGTRPERAAAGEPKTGDEAEDASGTGTDARRDTGAETGNAAQDDSGRAAGEPRTAPADEREDEREDEDGSEGAAHEASAGAPKAAASTADESHDADEDDDAEDDDEDDDEDDAPGAVSGGAGSSGGDDAGPDPDEDTGTDPSAGSGEAGAAPEEDGPEADAAPADAESKTGSGTGSAAESPAEDEAEAEDDAEPKAPATGSKAPAAGSEAPVDQPTAVFRTGRPSAPSVDQPTTMLKLGDTGAKAEPGDAGADAGDGAGSESGSGPKGESASERTSRFVALKEFDDPDTRKPPRGGDATTALRAVTPAAKPPAPAEATTSVPQVGPERTTQQPLPPKPPLDLLAELTNTPPPPETPLRTAVRRIKIWTPLVLLLVVVLAVVQNMRPLPAPTLELTAQDGYTFEGGKVDIPWPADGQAALDVQGIGTFGSSGEQKPVPIASVAKVMTAYLILRDHPLKSGAEGPMLKIDELAEKQSDAGQESTVTVTAGDEISQREAIEAILIASANNVARLLARWDAGSEKAFVEKMNDAAKDLGMTNTTYTDPSGLNDTTVSTAVDQVKLARAAMKQPAFREVAAMMSYDDYKGVNHPNWNQLVGSNDVVGIKTGTTTSALGNLVFAAKKEIDGETRTIVGAVVRQPAGGKDNTILSAALTSGDQLIRAAQGALESATILKKGAVVGYVDDGLGGRTPVAVTEDVKAVGWAGLSVKLTFAADELPHQAKAGTKVGTLTVGDGTSSAVKVPVALQEDLVEPGFTDKLTRLS
ncbi:D-alanyl-D-alanine carboxypeptidase [Streptomyces sp. Tu 3180]|uniref:D-alanyl-D-alanine carboxypeptidase n=1 Tax=Streptomyces sp. Tu 3180 TaxID=2682611 RepID=UPI001FB63A41|nr:D-alanyl-D-alanine carboxypeptidase [Streptomyces sp. Tu 3180]